MERERRWTTGAALTGRCGTTFALPLSWTFFCHKNRQTDTNCSTLTAPRPRYPRKNSPEAPRCGRCLSSSFPREDLHVKTWAVDFRPDFLSQLSPTSTTACDPHLYPHNPHF